VGLSENAVGVPHAFLWTIDTAMIDSAPRTAKRVIGRFVKFANSLVSPHVTPDSARSRDGVLRHLVRPVVTQALHFR
jgi:hypothetical protein